MEMQQQATDAYTVTLTEGGTVVRMSGAAAAAGAGPGAGAGCSFSGTAEGIAIVLAALLSGAIARFGPAMLPAVLSSVNPAAVTGMYDADGQGGFQQVT